MDLIKTVRPISQQLLDYFNEKIVNLRQSTVVSSAQISLALAMSTLDECVE